MELGDGPFVYLLLHNLMPCNTTWRAAGLHRQCLLFHFWNGMPLTAKKFRAIFCYHLKSLGFNPSLFNTHSFGIGAATAAAKAGMSSSTIMELCQGWHVILHHHGALPRLACHPPPSWSSSKAGMSSSTIMELCQGWHVILHHHGALPRLACHPPPSWSSAKAGMSSSTIKELCQGWHVILHHHGALPRLACHPPPSWSSAKAGMSSSTIMELCQGWHVILHHHGAQPRLACHLTPSWSSAAGAVLPSTATSVIIRPTPPLRLRWQRLTS